MLMTATRVIVGLSAYVLVWLISTMMSAIIAIMCICAGMLIVDVTISTINKVIMPNRKFILGICVGAVLCSCKSVTNIIFKIPGVKFA